MFPKDCTVIILTERSELKKDVQKVNEQILKFMFKKKDKKLFNFYSKNFII